MRSRLVTVAPDLVPGPPAGGSECGVYADGRRRDAGAELPEGSIVSVEGSTCGGPYLQRAHRARRTP